MIFGIKLKKHWNLKVTIVKRIANVQNFIQGVSKVMQKLQQNIPEVKI